MHAPSWPRGHATNTRPGDADNAWTGRQSYRSGRFGMLATLKRASGLKSVRSCMAPIRDQVINARVSTEGVAHFEGIRRCGSPWSCPVCGPTVRRARALEVDAAVAAHSAVHPIEGDEASALFVTVTMRHDRSQPLGRLLDALLVEWRKLQQTSGWRSSAARYHLSGVIKAVEVNKGPNGWHPHLHLILFLDEPMSLADRRDFSHWLASVWCERMVRAGFGTTHARHGVDVRRIAPADSAGGASVGRYMLDVIEGDGSGWGAGAELLRGDLKRGRYDHRSASQIMALAIEGGEAWAWYDWWEYEQATKGRRALTWSRGLRDRLGLGAEVDDEEAAIGPRDDLDDDALVVPVPRAVWVGHLQRGTLGDYLARIEAAAFLCWWLCGWAAAPPD